MKKFLALLLALVMVFALAACGEADAPASDAPASEAPASDAPASEAPADGAAGSVYYLNFKPEADAAWQELAALYTEQTGVPVKVVTAASGEYSSTLTAEMDKSDMPTLFQCGNQAGLDTWGDYCYDLTDSAVYKEMTTDDFNLFGENGEVYCIGYCYEAFGIIVNTALLAEAGYELSDITNFESLKSVAEDITARHATGELPFAAFSSAGLDSSSSWRFSGHLANMPLYYEFRDDGVTSQPAAITGAYLDNFKQIWDLYVANSDTAPAQLTTATSDQSKAEFGEGKAVFYQNGSWEYDSLVKDFGMDPANLAMIPIYCGVEGEEDAGLCCGTENCWAVNSKASEEDIQATLDFMYWVVTSDEGTTMMAEQFGPIPFKNAKESSNVFFNNANEYIAEGKYTVTWAFNYTPNVDSWRAAVVAALTQYTVGGGSWDDVVTAFVQGWATQYANQ
ncbi:MAG: ABC transporter substrate-binding protein [Oscillospiraceae bacterium]|uniref:ABC transporter substrate-binding protein n=1 Tax=Candidatus Scatomorpha intestinigallinarum TaxID=2840923 RepID=UPI003A441D9D